MLIISVVKNGSLKVYNKLEDKNYHAKDGAISIYCSSRQDLIFSIDDNKKSDIFILFVADFFLKRYLTSSTNEPIDFLYNKIQDEITLELINTQAIDALSLYRIDKIINVK